MKFIEEHKTSLIITLVCIILFVLMFIAVYSMFNPTSDKSLYGGRLDNEVEVPSNIIDEIKNEISSSDIVNSTSYNKNVKILKFFIEVKDNTKIKDAQKLASIITDKLDKQVLSYYDIEVYFKGNGDDYPAIGYHSKNASNFTFTINRGETNE